MTTIAMRHGKPTITTTKDGYSDEGGNHYAASEVRTMIQGGTYGDPTRAAIEYGLIDGDWPYQLADETDAARDARLQ